MREDDCSSSFDIIELMSYQGGEQILLNIFWSMNDLGNQWETVQAEQCPAALWSTLQPLPVCKTELET